jgi:predicted Fe-Mo cluster-binding NifX family protein
MKIAVSATGKDLHCEIDPRFGRCQYFIFVDPETMEFEVFENEGLMASGGAGVQAAQLIAQRGATALITGNLGPNAASALSASGIKVYLVPGGTVKDVIEGYKAGNLREAGGATVPSHFGMGGGQGMGGRRV